MKDLRHAVLAIAFALLAPTAAQAQVSSQSGVVFCRPQGKPLVLDLARPAGDGPFPTLVFIHGGAWIGGDRSVYTSELREHAATRGFVAVSLDYRLMDPDRGNVAAHPWPAQIDDVRCALRFLRANASRFAIDPERIGATGHSAGGQLSLLAGLDDPVLPPGAEWPGVSSRVQAVVNQSGPTDLAVLSRANEKTGSIVFMLLPGPPASFDARAAQASPVTFASADDPPVLTIHGDKDEQVPVSQALALDEALRKAGARHELVVLPGVPHAYDRETYGANRERIYAFFERTLR